MDLNNFWIVITTIFSPSKPILEYIEICKTMGFNLLIVGDTKTPDTYKKLDCIFLSLLLIFLVSINSP